MRDCETCPLRIDLVPERHEQSGTPAAVRRITDEIYTGLEAERRACPGWSLGRYTLYQLTHSLGIDGLNVATPHENACNNPFRATDEYWDLRSKMILVVDRHMGGAKFDTHDGKFKADMKNMMLDTTKSITSKRITKQQRKLGNR